MNDELIELFTKLSEENKDIILVLIKAFLSSY